LTPYLPKKFWRWATQSGIAEVLMLAWVIMTSPEAASESLLVARTKALKSKLTSIFSTARFTITSEA
jgi:hypothetical protein